MVKDTKKGGVKMANEELTEEEALKLGIWASQRARPDWNPEQVAFAMTTSWFFEKAFSEQVRKMGFREDAVRQNSSEAAQRFGEYMNEWRVDLKMDEWFDKDWAPPWFEKEEKEV